ncbi:hypothetical protein CIK06_03770 [Plantactinospora sp. KBS50]|nr:hypothetical protein CIK06_03770 [Plantactinospora sp. KBS50]
MAVPLSGCGPASTAQPASGAPGGAAESPEQSPKEKLLAAVPDGSEGTFQFSSNDGTTAISGSIDPESKAYQIGTSGEESGITIKMSFLTVGDQTWAKVKLSGDRAVLAALPKFPNRWMHLDPAKMTGDDAVPQLDGADQGNVGPLVENATSVEDKGDGKYAGIIDLTAGEAAKVLEADQMKALGAAATQVPFTAQVTGDKLTAFTMQVPAAGKQKAFQYVATYGGFGTTPKLTAPTGSAAQEAPADLYEFLQG